MKRVNIICEGKLKEKHFFDAFAEYAKRLSRFCDLRVIETTTMVPYLNRGLTVVLDVGGALMTSEELSKTLDKAYITASEVNFFIGGSTGLCETVKAAADITISFGRFTYPHQLMRVMLAEQIYRAFCITAGVKYHK